MATPERASSSMGGRARWELEGGGTLGATVRARLARGVAVQCESGAIVTCSENVQLKGTIGSSWIQAALRSAFAQESFFLCECRANDDLDADVLFAPASFGDVVLHRLGETDALYFIKGAFLAADLDVQVTAELQPNLANSMLSGTGWVILRASTVRHASMPGAAHIAINASGRILRMSLGPRECRVVDNGHILAWTGSVRYEIRLATPNSLVHSFTSGEKLVCRFYGPGTLYIQTHKSSEVQLISCRSSRGDRMVQTHRHASGVLGSVASLVGLLIFAFFFVGVVYSIFWQWTSAFRTISAPGWDQWERAHWSGRRAHR
ncbi:Uncharacterized protein FVE85_8406 [Porphyridium purpureum]|uniref:Uncharacterized protein n=1 Tax=Porphyridium purpureum TaxID=35688 RepID=A0A5J4YMM6_PORPP|nr:Uncharacterized protein FVE85_8406 [Porphyridium purpureum]|eukprot:POR6560..scf244_11